MVKKLADDKYILILQVLSSLDWFKNSLLIELGLIVKPEKLLEIISVLGGKEIRIPKIKQLRLATLTADYIRDIHFKRISKQNLHVANAKFEKDNKISKKDMETIISNYQGWVDLQKREKWWNE